MTDSEEINPFNARDVGKISLNLAKSSAGDKKKTLTNLNFAVRTSSSVAPLLGHKWLV